MTARRVLDVVGTAVGGVIGWTRDPLPAADPRSVRALFADLGVPAGADLDTTVRRFQQRAGLDVDGRAGPRTVHLLARYAEEARELSHLTSAVVMR